MQLQPGQNIISELTALIDDPSKEAFWQEYTNEIMQFLQTEIEAGYSADDTLRQLYLAGKIM